MAKRRSKNNSKSNKKGLVVSAVITAVVLFVLAGAGCGLFTNPQKISSALLGGSSNTDYSKSTSVSPSGDRLKVSFLDIGLGDSILIERNGHALVIDGGTRDASDDIVKYIKQQNISSIDCLIATHPHEDHIGGIDDIINNFTVKDFIMPECTQTTKVYKEVLDAAAKKKLKITRPQAGKTYSFEGAQFTILAPNSSKYDEINNYSIVLRLSYGSTSFMFTGDAEKLSESEMINKGYELKSDVLKVGHHGSLTSTSPDFLSAVSPKYAVISSADGEKNLPAEKTVSRINKAGIKLYETYKNGTVIAESDGKNITFKTEKAA